MRSIDSSNLNNRLTKSLKQHLVDSTALLAESTPVFAAFEVGLAGMSEDISINARLVSAGLTYLGGMGYAYAKGRDTYRKILNITDKTKEKIQSLNDAVYLGIFNVAVSPIIYVASGARDPKEIAIVTASGLALGLVNGAPMGYAVDIFRDLTGLKNCERKSYPELLKRQNPNTKKSLASLLVAGAITLTAGIYYLTYDSNDSSLDVFPQQTIELADQHKN